MTTKVDKSTTDFFLDQVIGGRSAIRLMNSACGWAKEITGKTDFVFFGCELDTAALSKNWLKPLDNQIYIVKGLGALFAFKDKCWDRVKKEDVSSILRAVQHALKTVADTSAGIRCLATFGAVCLSPYFRTLSLMKNSFSVAAGIAEIAFRVHDMITLSWQPAATEEEKNDINLQLTGHAAMICTQLFSIQLNFFGGCYSALKGVDADTYVPEVLFNLWGTCASSSALVYSAIEYVRAK